MIIGKKVKRIVYQSDRKYLNQGYYVQSSISDDEDSYHYFHQKKKKKNQDVSFLCLHCII